MPNSNTRSTPEGKNLWAIALLNGLPGNLPSVTGAREATVIGVIFPANRSIR
ncbi:hypothetical protein ACZ87_03552 [Candidatus Erwinia dacicola]|uniref:Uncharacterized protein n=1 Tax=Candidatus Erwinia dacicola TaxID=252393 RepID=A0A328TGX4_9GAMM|nr:hypothetical protein ACZ87_03552 [Candidatus Erwinia dacicola]